MLDDYLQQWTALQTVRASNLRVDEVFVAYGSIGGAADEVDVTGYLTGLVMIPTLERDLIAQAINELLDVTGSIVDGAHYSTDGITVGSGYGEYLRALVLSPDGYAFHLPAVGDASTITTSPYASHNASGGAFQRADNAELDATADDEREFRRCHALYESGLLETGAEERFDRITAQARNHFGVSSASIALITEDSQVIKSVIGPIGQDLPRDIALCARTIEKDRTLVITDAGTDPDYRDHPLVAGGPEVRFYAGHPVSTTGGWRIGTLCLIDDRPRAFTEDDKQALRTFAARVQSEMWRTTSQ
ncbi:GAF domain-containing protein [Arthrobacter sp. H41]|uniref:GAF domain-containing protein n=1 Tax=Arthrobacter sp. H41 TaxID=1312978 RepID=UPI0004BCBC6B|nr:GAF domain-containing protein [Arthrobacter sp. H41]